MKPRSGSSSIRADNVIDGEALFGERLTRLMRGEVSRAASARCGHVTRRLTRNVPLKGKVLQFSLGVIEESRKGFSDGGFLDRLAGKLAKGQRLDDYEAHIMLDVLLPHYRLDGWRRGN